MKKIIVIGAGPGGLATALMLVSKGYDVTIYEKQDAPGGRSRRLSLGDYHFDLGPTFLMYLDVLKDIFRRSGEDIEHHLDLKRLDPLYRLSFEDHDFVMRADPLMNKDIFDAYAPGSGKRYMGWLDEQERKFNAIRPILEKPFPSLLSGLRADVIKALPYLHPLQSVYSNLKKHVKDETIIHALSFQAKYLGMASYQAPSIFTILPYLEHGKGLYHVIGGIHQIHQKMAELFTSKGGKLHLSTPVKEILIRNKTAHAVMLEDGIVDAADAVVLNADFAHAITHLVDSKHLKKYARPKMEKKKFSVSTFMIYLGLDTLFDFEHHAILFSKDYPAYLTSLMDNALSEDFSYYMHNPSKLDPTLAPEGHSSLYILAPVPNLKLKVDWDAYGKSLRDKIISDIENRFGIDLSSHIRVEKTYTPKDWLEKDHIHLGAVFNLSHGYDQMLFNRPHNRFEEIRNLYLVGGGTHPGSGLPTIYQSACIAMDLICG